MTDKPQEYIVQCFNCLGEFDALSAVWCNHDPLNPTKICPFCLNCFCNVPEDNIKEFWAHAPPELVAEHDAFMQNRHPLGNLIVQAGLLTMDQLLLAVAEQEQSKERLGELLVRLGFVLEDELKFFLKVQNFDVPSPLPPDLIEPEILNRLTPAFCLKYRIVPIMKEETGRRTFVVFLAPHRRQRELWEDLHERLDAYPVFLLANEDDIVQLLQTLLKPTAKNESPPEAKSWLSQLLATAIGRGASDIHFEPGTGQSQIRIRIDGVLYKWQSISNDAYKKVINHIMQFFNLERRWDLTQKGDITLSVDNKKYKIHCLILPGTGLPAITMKLINLSSFLKGINELGLLPDQEPLIIKALTQQTGLIVVSGPPMHGTVTTEYALLNYLGRFDKKIVTVESPVHYPLPGAQQMSIEPAEGRDLMANLDHLRMLHPDVIYIASVPTPAIFTAIVEHTTSALVIVDLNSMNVWEALDWILESGASRITLANSLKLIMNQRLVRRICPSCRHASSLQPGLLVHLGLTPTEAENIIPYEGAGCRRCNHLGYRGRVALFEVLDWTEALAQSLRTGQTIEALKQAATGTGFRSLRSACLAKIAEGLTTVEEMQRWNIKD